MVATGNIVSNPFQFDSVSLMGASDFSLTFLAEGFIWEYELSFKEKKVLKESLYRYPQKSSMKQPEKYLIYLRNLEEKDTAKQFAVGGKAFKFRQKDLDSLSVYGKTVNSSTLFIHFCRSLNIPIFSDFINVVNDWICFTLNLIDANSVHGLLGLAIARQASAFSYALKQADTGIEDIAPQKYDCKDMDIPEEALQKFRESSSDVLIPSKDPDSFVRKEESKGAEGGEAILQGYRCEIKHSGADKEMYALAYGDESDGTRRFLHLLPIVLNPTKESMRRTHVYVVDEIDRSLHTQLSQLLIQQHLDNIRERNQDQEGQDKKPVYNEQLIFTTHDVMLMDQDLLRRDEIWVAERGRDNVSVLIAFEEFKDIRKDKDIRRSYLLGRMGGIPHLGFSLRSY